MIFAPGLVFGGIESDGSHFRRYRGHRIPFSCFALPDSFWAVPRALAPIFMFCTPRLVYYGTEGVRSRFNVLSSQTRFRRYRGHRLPFSCFSLPDTFPVVPRASDPVFMFCAPRHVSRGTEGVGSCFHILRSRTHFLRYRGCWLPFSYFALPYSFSAGPRGSGPFSYFALPDMFLAVRMV
jgi:hypothetical protein